MHLKHKYCLAQKLIKCKHAIYSEKSKGQSSCRVMYAGQTDWQHESRVCVHYVLHWLSHGWINENVTEWIVLNLGSSGPSITSLLSTLSWTLPGTGSGNVDWFAAPFPTKWTVHWHLKSVSTSFALNHWPTDGFMQCKTALLGSKPEGADVYISPHTRNSGGGAVAPSPPPRDRRLWKRTK